jgi:hypothetical protein
MEAEGGMHALALVFTIMVAIHLSGCAYLFHGTSDQINIHSTDPDAMIYLNNRLIGRGSATATVDRGQEYTIVAKASGCADGIDRTSYRFDPISLLGLLIDVGIISILVVDMGATGAAWKTHPLSYTVNPICPAVASQQGESRTRTH